MKSNRQSRTRLLVITLRPYTSEICGICRAGSRRYRRGGAFGCGRELVHARLRAGTKTRSAHGFSAGRWVTLRREPASKSQQSNSSQSLTFCGYADSHHRIFCTYSGAADTLSCDLGSQPHDSRTIPLCVSITRGCQPQGATGNQRVAASPL